MTDYEQQADDFLKDHNVQLTTKFERFAPMPWDEDGQHRNVFECKLTTEEGEYSFDFGDSLENSCKHIMKPQREVLDTIEVYAGLKTVNASAGIMFKLFKRDDFNLSDERMQQLVDDFEHNYLSSVDSKNKAILNKYEEGKISRNLRDAKLINPLQKGAFQQCLQNAIKRELEKEVESYDSADTPIIPTNYGILACLSVSYFKDADEVAEEFGSMKPSQAQAIFEQDQELQRIFSEDQLEALSEIS